jgi:hypothetical protein
VRRGIPGMHAYSGSNRFRISLSRHSQGGSSVFFGLRRGFLLKYSLDFLKEAKGSTIRAVDLRVFHPARPPLRQCGFVQSFFMSGVFDGR